MLFRLSEVHKSYGTQDVLRGVSLQVNPGEHVGLVGRNGSGKTTIFRLINQEEQADRGDVIRAKGVRLGLRPASPGTVASPATSTPVPQSTTPATAATPAAATSPKATATVKP